MIDEEGFSLTQESEGLVIRFSNLKTGLSVSQTNDQVFSLSRDFLVDIMPLSEADPILQEYYYALGLSEDDLVFDAGIFDEDFEEYDFDEEDDCEVGEDCKTYPDLGVLSIEVLLVGHRKFVFMI